MSWTQIETAAYWAVFVTAFLAVAIWESTQPKAKLQEPVERRWRVHGALFAVCIVAAGLLLRMAPVYYAFSLAGTAHGLLSRPWMPPAAGFVLGILAFDFVNYSVHRLMHAVGLLWRVHEIHHSDRDFDVST